MAVRRLGPAALLAVAAALQGVTAMPATAAAAPAVAPARGVLFGAYADLSTGKNPSQAISTLETAAGRRLDLHRIYRRWDDPEPGASVTATVRAGRIPVLSIKPKYRDGRLLRWADVAAGRADAQIAAQADGLRRLPGRLLLTFHHEPDYDVRDGYGTAAEYVAAWRHYRAVFAARGVRNVQFAWITTTGAYARAGVADAFYPGDAAVDWIGVDVFNWFDCNRGRPAAWRSLHELTAQFAAWARPHRKPLILAEWGSVEDPARPGRKAAWIRDSIATARAWPQLKAMAYFDTTGSCHWELSTSASARRAFAMAGADPWTRTR
jgi:hypothetical protein